MLVINYWGFNSKLTFAFNSSKCDKFYGPVDVYDRKSVSKNSYLCIVMLLSSHFYRATVVMCSSLNEDVASPETVVCHVLAPHMKYANRNAYVTSVSR